MVWVQDLARRHFLAEKRVLVTRWQRKNGLEPGNIPFAPEAPLDTALPYHTSFMGSCPNMQQWKVKVNRGPFLESC